MPIEKIRTGVPGLDRVLKGGLRKNTTLLITGSPGTGKTIMALQFIYNGAKQFGEKGIFISTEENAAELRAYAGELGMDLEKYEKTGKLFLFEERVEFLKGGLASIQGLIDMIKTKKIQRVALDSIIFFEYLYQRTKNEMDYRRHVILFLRKLKDAGVTFLTISERKITDLDKLEYNMLDFIFEGFIITSRIRKGSYFERIMTVAKLRGQDHSLEVYPINIGKGGVKVMSDQIPFSLSEKKEMF